MKRIAVLIIGLSFLAGMSGVEAQDFKKEVYVKEHVPNKEPVPYPYVREADVMWSKVVWRMVDLRQKQNLPLYYPTEPIGKRMSLVDLLLYGIDNEGITAYSPDDALNEFTVPMTRDQVDAKFDAGVDTIMTQDVETGELIPQAVERPRQTNQVRQVLVKEKWYFDKKYSTMRVRIIGLCPIRVYYREDDQGLPTDELLKEQTFWVYFPEVRPLLSSHEIFNRNNDAQRISYDDFFWQRRFNGYIYGESNVYNDRKIREYTSGIDQMLESQKIKESIMNYEHDLWEY
ncbi:MAG: gliding motility protein GldN [Bacteroidetes bacterium]|jgi:gliding motility associated protien GldN|nr:gliding motility protein GldN [Bacteroidota bacterium]